MAEQYQLFHYDSCFYCGRVRGFIEQSGLRIPYRNIHTEQGAHQELISGGGRGTVPCLRIETGEDVRWLYESADIIEYLRTKAA